MIMSLDPFLFLSVYFRQIRYHYDIEKLQLKKVTTSWQKKREHQNKIRPNKQIAVTNVKDEYNSPFFVCIINVWT